ncbi:hypothetical protein H696_02656 [Fonticula alba]|uniref:AB hydrolase-1 domain-containing protein n=1 Tax=Fonticula alba TaxID=691883 RepID=A0A058Z7Q6_FONAL|nr:hypothetical protein H696_02656 [Fonticula alba]KCV70329.1 hypothetical protein H696_02656 [Fonticula alba]|eukprot:XP_009494845.1 hypothetical protein H696_02656 [Fonticula alba]
MLSTARSLVAGTAARAVAASSAAGAPLARAHFSVAPASEAFFQGKAVPLDFHRQDPPADNVRLFKSPIIILPGLLGSRQNWRSMSKLLASRTGRTVFSLDMRNHGSSPWSAPEHAGYDYMAADIAAFVTEHLSEFDRDFVLLGHSMGGKTVMHYALNAPFDLQPGRIVVADILPEQSPNASFSEILQAMITTEERRVGTRPEAEQILADMGVTNERVRAFVGTNLVKGQLPEALAAALPGHTDEQFYFRCNTRALQAALGEIMAVPAYSPDQVYSGRSLFVGGRKADYVPDDPSRVAATLAGHFGPFVEDPADPDAKEGWSLRMLDTGHWIHADDPWGFTHQVEAFLDNAA